MIRVVKDPDARKQELVDTAEKLFIRYGYDEVSVSDIVKKAGVAQGTFYYYFKSKDDMRNAVIEKNIDEVKELIDSIISRDDFSAMEKMAAYSLSFQQWGRDHEKLTDYIHEEKNEVLHYRMSRKVLEYLVPAYTKIIEQGVDEGVFQTKYPDLASMAIMGITEAIFEGEHNPKMEDPETKRKYTAVIEFSEKILDAEPGIFVKFAKEKGVDI
jgi:AcrR family transcriptional regulator